MEAIHGSRVRRRLRRPILAAAATVALSAPAIAAGCGGGFDPISKVNALRVLAVVADKPYVTLCEEEPCKGGENDVTFDMTYYDGYVDPEDPTSSRKVTVFWIGGCFDPPGDEYYGCYEQLAQAFQGYTPGMPVDNAGIGPTFTLSLPSDLISRRPKPTVGPHYGIAYVFFAACAGEVKPIPPEGTGKAGSFPLGCFDEGDGHRLGPESFVAGYTQIYAFGDGRTNANPKPKAFLINGKPVEEGVGNEIEVAACDVPEDKRDPATAGCTAQDPYTTCETLEIDVDVPKDQIEIDPDGISADGKPLHEVVWVDYFADKGDFNGGIKLIGDATTGLLSDHKTTWIAPREPGRVTLWAVVHDARGGAAVLSRYVIVR